MGLGRKARNSAAIGVTRNTGPWRETKAQPSSAKLLILDATTVSALMEQCVALVWLPTLPYFEPYSLFRDQAGTVIHQQVPFPSSWGSSEQAF